MSKVLVDPAALEEAAKWLEVHSSSSGSAEAFAADALREAIAQPAEAEGVERWNELKKLAEKATPGPWWVDSHGHRVSTEDGMQTVFIAADKMGPATRHPETGNLSHWPNDWDASYIVNASPDKILELIAALLAVTAERDRLESTLIQTTTRHFAQQWKDRADDKKLDECLSEGIAMLEADRDQLRAEVDGLRKDAERYRWLRKMHESRYGLTLTIARVGMMELTGWSGDDPDSVIDAAMAAKEA